MPRSKDNLPWSNTMAIAKVAEVTTHGGPKVVSLTHVGGQVRGVADHSCQGGSQVKDA